MQAHSLSFTEPSLMSDEVHSYIQLNRSITPCARSIPTGLSRTGNCLTCDSYESRLADPAWPFSPDEQCYTERRNFGSDLRNCVGERPTIRLKARLKFVMD